MFNFEKFKEQAMRILCIPSNAESGNEELVRYLQTIMHDIGFKTQTQQVNHSHDRLSKRQYNLMGFSSDNLVDRTTRKGVLFINPLDVTTGNLPHLWTATQGNPNAPVSNDKGVVGAGAVQGKLDFLCRIYGAQAVVSKRHKTPLYLVGTCASHFGMMGSRFLIESLSVNPKEVFSFAPTDLAVCKQAVGHMAYSLDIDSPSKNRDTRGYNRCVDITTYGLSVDFSSPDLAINAFDLLIDALVDAAGEGFDFQWSMLEVKGAEGTNPDIARAKIYLTSFQFEDFKQFLKSKISSLDAQRFFRIEYSAASDSGISFIPSALIELILEIDSEWKQLIAELNTSPNAAFHPSISVGTLTRIEQKPTGKIAVALELRFLPNHNPIEIDQKWKARAKVIFDKYNSFHFTMNREYLVPGFAMDQTSVSKNSNYLSDMGWFAKQKFPVSSIGVGSAAELPKGPNEAILWSELEKAVQVYSDLMNTSSL